MPGKPQFCNSLFRITSPAATTTLGLALALVLTVVLAQSAPTQTFKVVHNFTGGADGANPETGLTMDAAGNFYGTAYSGGSGYGLIFKLKQYGSGWILTPLYTFASGTDGANPLGRAVVAADATLYGTTYNGGIGCGTQGCGTVFHLRPPSSAPKSALVSWNETVLYRFRGGGDGQNPSGDLTFDQSGNVYGTTPWEGAGYGVIYRLTSSGGSWTQTVLYEPQTWAEGSQPVGGVVFDKSGNLYGVFSSGGPYGYGAVYQLSPSGPGWTVQILYAFTGGSDGSTPAGGLVFDPSGNLYGTTSFYGDGGSGTVFELTLANGNWTFSTLYSFSKGSGYGPSDKLILDAAGNLYGAIGGYGGYAEGSVFKLTRSNGGWAYTSLHDFTGGSDGGYPNGSLVFDANGNLYGTAYGGGAYGYGVVWEISPQGKR